MPKSPELINQPRAENEQDKAPFSAVACDQVVRECLDRILSSRTFRAADGQRNFLRYAMEEALAGRGDRLKEYSVGIEVFNRGDAFDPRVDNIVRAEARKLRVRLAKYYALEGAADPVRFELPKGSYAPLIVAPEAAEQGASGDNNSNSALAGPASPEMETPFAAPAASPESLPQPESSGLWPAFRRNWSVAAIAVACTIVAGLSLWFVWSRSHRAATTDSSPSVAVLPFRNLGDSPKDDAFSDGLTEDLIDSLVRVPGLHVVARTSAFEFKGAAQDAPDIGRKLHVRTLLEGTVRQYGNRLRVTAKLEQTDTGFTVWSKSFDRELKDVLGVQREISTSIVNSLGSSLAGEGALAHGAREDANVAPDVYQSWLKGLYFYNRHTGPSIDTAIVWFTEATKKDPNYAPAWLGLARCYSVVPVLTAAVPAGEAVARIRSAANRALQLDPTLGGAHIALAYSYITELDWPRAEAEIRKGLALNPGDAAAHQAYSSYLVRVGRLNDALNESTAALDLDPLSAQAETSLARVLYDLGRIDESIADYKQAESLDPESGGASQGLAMAYVAAGRFSEGVTEAEKARRLNGGDAMITSDLGYAEARSGQTTPAREILDRLLHWRGAAQVRALPIAHVYLGLGDRERAFEWLNKALDQKDLNLYLKTDPRYASLRSDPRFAQLLTRARL